jgi:integrase
VYRRRDGRWVAAVVDPGPPRRRVVRYATTEKDALRLARDLARDRDRRRLPAGGRQPTTGQYLTEWLADVAPATVKPTSLRDYASKLRLYVLPVVGAVRLDRLTTGDLRAVDAAMTAQGRAVATRRKTLSIVRSALAEAVAEGRIPRNPAIFRMPTPPRGGGAALTLDEARAVLAAARGDRLEARWYAALLGVRQGETLRLRWGEGVALDPPTLTVQRSKSVASERTLPLPEPLAAAFRRRWSHHRVELAAAGDGYHDGGLVFCRPDGRPLDPRADYQAWVDLLARAGVRRVRLHDARHTAATLLLRAGVDIALVRDWLGHSAITLTVDTYGHLGDVATLTPAGGVLGQLLAPPAD